MPIIGNCGSGPIYTKRWIEYQNVGAFVTAMKYAPPNSVHKLMFEGHGSYAEQGFDRAENSNAGGKIKASWHFGKPVVRFLTPTEDIKIQDLLKHQDIESIELRGCGTAGGLGRPVPGPNVPELYGMLAGVTSSDSNDPRYHVRDENIANAIATLLPGTDVTGYLDPVVFGYWDTAQTRTYNQPVGPNR